MSDAEVLFPFALGTVGLLMTTGVTAMILGFDTVARYALMAVVLPLVAVLGIVSVLMIALPVYDWAADE